MDDRVFLRVLVPEVTQHCFHVGAVEHVHDIADAELIEIHALPFVAPANVQKVGKQFFQERIGLRHHVSKIVGNDPDGP